MIAAATPAAALAATPSSDGTSIAVVGAGGAHLIGQLKSRGWNRVTAVLTPPQRGTAVQLLRAGATSIMVSGRASTESATGPVQLTERETHVIRMVADGLTNKEIGAALELSALTVKSHLARIGRKFGTGERAHIVMLALRAGHID